MMNAIIIINKLICTCIVMMMVMNDVIGINFRTVWWRERASEIDKLFSFVGIC